MSPLPLVVALLAVSARAAGKMDVVIEVRPGSGSSVDQLQLRTMAYLAGGFDSCDFLPGAPVHQYRCRGKPLDLVEKAEVATYLRSIWGKSAQLSIGNADAPRPSPKTQVQGDQIDALLKSLGPVTASRPAPAVPGKAVKAQDVTKADRVFRDRSGKVIRSDKVNGCRQYSAELCAAHREAVGGPIDLNVFYLAKAIIDREGVWDPDANGDNGRSYGLMQIQFATAKRLGYEKDSPDGLFDPSTNLKWGLRELHRCLSAAVKASKDSQFAAYSRTNLTLGCYNYGKPAFNKSGQLISTKNYHEEVADRAQAFQEGCRYASARAACGSAP